MRMLANHDLERELSASYGITSNPRGAILKLAAIRKKTRSVPPSSVNQSYMKDFKVPRSAGTSVVERCAMRHGCGPPKKRLDRGTSQEGDALLADLGALSIIGIIGFLYLPNRKWHENGKAA